MPISSSLCPSIPRNETLERSGSLRAASPPPCDCANALGAATEKATIANKKLMILRRCAATKFDIDFTIKRILPFRLGERREKMPADLKAYYCRLAQKCPTASALPSLS